MMAKVCFQMIVYNSDWVLEPCLESILPYGPVIVTEGPVKHWADRKLEPDSTCEILNRMVGPENIVHGVWPEKDEMQNAVLHLIPEGTTHLWLVDSDEIWDPEDIEYILHDLDDWDSMSFRATSFYGGFDRYITGFEEDFEVHRIQRWYPGARWQTHRPPTILAPDGKPWREHRHRNHMDNDRLKLRYWHYSYVFPKQMKMKADYYADLSKGLHIDGYFEKVYLPWVEGRREEVEREFLGVHNWKPQARGPTYTRPYTGQHTFHIQKRMPELKARFDRELREMKGA